ncbi:MAG TPA: ATP-binding protein [Trebonia sp.]|jgi:signal transduction histidine kinase|nr:ATP-binding protein [Trebonia sp.]
MSYAHGWPDELRQACHDIRQPIAGVLALAEAALSEADLPENTRGSLDKIIGLAEWQSDVIEHWLWAPGDWSSKTQETDVLGVITEAVAAQQVTWAGDLTVLWPPGPVLAGLPRVTLRCMTANLLDNATRAAGPSGKVTVEVSVRATQMLLAVEDDGPGFGLLPGGCGLGLSAVAREANEYNGRLECGRAGLGGARVSLLLPIATPGKGGRITNAARAL